MIMSRRTAITALGAAGASLWSATLQAQARAQSDSQWVRELLEAFHPGLYRYQSHADFARRHARFSRSFEDGSFDQKVLALQSLLGAIRCGHTFINPANQTEPIRARMYGSRRFVPFAFRWIGDTMVVTGDPRDVGLAPGTQVNAIDGRSTALILRQLMPLARADGGNDAKRRALMSVTGTERTAMFDLYYGLLFQPGQTLRLDVTKPDGTQKPLEVKTLSYAERLEASSQAAGSGETDPIWSARKASGGTTRIITMPTWATYKTKWDWEGWLRALLGEVLSDGTTGLVFDLRGNEGGNNIGEGMLPFLLREPLSISKPQELVRFASVPDRLRGPLNTWDPSFYEIGKLGRPINARFIEKSPASEQRIAPQGPGFGGKIAVLIGADNSSATFSFASQVRESGLGTLIGEPTGGNQRGINGGAYFFTRLPESGLEIDIPLIGYYPPGVAPDAGLDPDIEVATTAQSIASEEDAAMKAALAAVA